jgi:response regulator RpfG family c-di-GMP phosphodiesterase
MTDQILFVDDEPYLLQSFQRELGFLYEIQTAQSGLDGMNRLRTNPKIAVVVADYRMPQMNGIQFLALVREEFPNVVRVMLTGNADLPTAIEAVNEGQVFRFLLKPCPMDTMQPALESSVKQHHLIIAEKELLENTLLESVNMLTEVINIVNPLAYGRALRIRQWVYHVVRAMHIEPVWEFELAAALANLGWIIFPPAMLDRLAKSSPLSPEDLLLYAKHPFIAMNLIGRIPRLGRVARMIAGQERSIQDLCLEPTNSDSYIADLGSHMLRTCSEFDRLLQAGMLPGEALQVLREQNGAFLPAILDALEELKISALPSDGAGLVAEAVEIEDLASGMRLAEPIKDSFGKVLYPSGTIVDRQMILDLFRFSIRPGYIPNHVQVFRAANGQ